MKILNLLFCWPHCSFPVVRALDWQLAVRFHKKINPNWRIDVSSIHLGEH
jgi:hypothetical protein